MMIHHVPLRKNRVQLLREAARVVKPSGRVLLTYHDHDIVKTHEPWGGQLPPEAKAQEMAAGYTILTQTDSFTRSCQGKPTNAYGYVHGHTRSEMEAEVQEAGLAIVARADFRTIGGGEPDEFWKPTQILVLQPALM